MCWQPFGEESGSALAHARFQGRAAKHAGWPGSSSPPPRRRFPAKGRRSSPEHPEPCIELSVSFSCLQSIMLLQADQCYFRKIRCGVEWDWLQPCPTPHATKKLLDRIRRIQGQLNGVKKALGQGAVDSRRLSGWHEFARGGNPRGVCSREYVRTSRHPNPVPARWTQRMNPSS